MKTLLAALALTLPTFASAGAAITRVGAARPATALAVTPFSRFPRLSPLDEHGFGAMHELFHAAGYRTSMGLGPAPDSPQYHAMMAAREKQLVARVAGTAAPAEASAPAESSAPTALTGVNVTTLDASGAWTSHPHAGSGLTVTRRLLGAPHMPPAKL